jgi:hypothetical protein
LQKFVEDVYSTYCVNGILAIQNNIQMSIAYPDSWPASGYILVRDQFTFLAWAVQDNCPGWD